ncbi:MAG: hypothetical protein WCB44_17350 [Stellaceae bacterium]
MTARTRRQFLTATGVTLTAALVAIPARAQLAGQAATTRPPYKAGVAPGYIISGRGEHPGNPYFAPQGKATNQHLPRPQAVHGKGLMEEDTP